MCLQCVRTVFSDMKRSSAMAAMERPRAISSMTSVSREERPYCTFTTKHCFERRSVMTCPSLAMAFFGFPIRALLARRKSPWMQEAPYQVRKRL